MNVHLLEPLLAKAIDLGVAHMTKKKKQVDRLQELDRRIARLDEIMKRLDDGANNRRTPDFNPQEVSTGCIPCARAHLATVAGTLKEALRFAREEGIGHPEVQSRLQTAEEDITNIERHDWTPEKILKSPSGEREVILRFIPRLRKLRQEIMQIASVEDLERAAAHAGELSKDFRLEVLKLRGVDTSKVVELARKVENGEMSLEEAKEQLKGEVGNVRDSGN